MEIVGKFIKNLGMHLNGNRCPSIVTDLDNNLTLIGNKISNTKMTDIEDEVLASIANEILR